MKLTDDFLADLETQLGAASAGRMRPRRRSPGRALRPLLATAGAAAAVTAFVLAAASGGGDPERAADPPPPAGGGPFTLPAAHGGVCAAEPEPVALPGLSVLRRPRDGDVAIDSPQARTARSDAPVTVIPTGNVGVCIDTGPDGVGHVPGACVVVDLDRRRSACWTLSEIEAGRAAAALGEGFLIALLPDRVREVTFVIGRERDTYAVTDNVVVANLEGAKAGATIELVPVTSPPPGCGNATIEDGPLPEELQIAIPVLREAEPAPVQPPDLLVDRLSEAGANRMWPGQARRHEGDGTSQAWLVPVADSRFADCRDALVIAPREFEGPGACLAIMHAEQVKTVKCAPLDDLAGIVTAAVPGGRVAGAFLPHGAHSVEIEGTVLRDAEPPWGVVFGAIPDHDPLSYVFLGTGGPVSTDDLTDRTVSLIAPTEKLANEARDRLQRAGVRTIAVMAGPAADRSRVMYAAGMARAARQMAEALRIDDVRPLDLATEALADPLDVVVVAGEDLRP